jgi:hypothetical protein
MTAPMDCRLVGRWRIVQSDLWDRAHLDLVEPAMMTIGAAGHGEIAFGALQAGLEFTGSGSAELNHDGTIEIEFTYHLRDEVILKAERMTSSTAARRPDATAVTGGTDASRGQNALDGGAVASLSAITSPPY